MKRIPPTLDPGEKPLDIAVPPRPVRRRRPMHRRVLLFALVLPLVTVHALIAALRWIPPPTTAFMLASPVRPVAYHWVPRERIPDSARQAVVAAEDQKFWDHGGFDLEAIGKALEHNKRRGRIRGASTISQQTAKNLFLWNGRSWLRKGLEAWLTLFLEWTWGKERILEVYLNVAEFGPGVFGVEAAARHYFGKPARDLTPLETARLAAVLPSPRKWRVLNPGPYVQSRTGWILRQMGHGPPPQPETHAEPTVPETYPESGIEPGVERPAHETASEAGTGPMGPEPEPVEPDPDPTEPDPEPMEPDPGPESTFPQ